jgi:hypothetical protein
VVEQRTENPRVSGSTPLLGTTYEVVQRIRPTVEYLPAQRETAENIEKRLRPRGQVRRSGGKVDATVSKTVGGQPPCRFESDLRHHGLSCRRLLVPGCVAVAQRTLDPLAQVRILARQPTEIRDDRPDGLISRQKQ